MRNRSARVSAGQRGRPELAPRPPGSNSQSSISRRIDSRSALRVVAGSSPSPFKTSSRISEASIGSASSSGVSPVSQKPTPTHNSPRSASLLDAGAATRRVSHPRGSSRVSRSRADARNRTRVGRLDGGVADTCIAVKEALLRCRRCTARVATNTRPVGNARACSERVSDGSSRCAAGHRQPGRSAPNFFDQRARLDWLRRRLRRRLLGGLGHSSIMHHRLAESPMRAPRERGRSSQRERLGTGSS